MTRKHLWFPSLDLSSRKPVSLLSFSQGSIISLSLMLFRYHCWTIQTHKYDRWWRSVRCFSCPQSESLHIENVSTMGWASLSFLVGYSLYVKLRSSCPYDSSVTDSHWFQCPVEEWSSHLSIPSDLETRPSTDLLVVASWPVIVDRSTRLRYFSLLNSAGQSNRIDRRHDLIDLSTSQTRGAADWTRSDFCGRSTEWLDEVSLSNVERFAQYQWDCFHQHDKSQSSLIDDLEISSATIDSQMPYFAIAVRRWRTRCRDVASHKDGKNSSFRSPPSEKNCSLGRLSDAILAFRHQTIRHLANVRTLR